MMTGAPPRIPVGCGAFVSFHPSLGSVAAHETRRPGRAAGVLLACRACRAPAGRTSWARSTPRSSSPTTRTAPSFRVRDVALPARADRRPLRRPRRDLRAEVDQLPAHHRQGRRPTRSLALDEHYQQALRPDDLAGGPGGVRHPPRADEGPRRLRPQRRSASGRCWPAGWSRPACRSSRSTTAAGTTTPTSSPRSSKRLPPLRPDGRRPDRRPRRSAACWTTTLVIALGEFGRTPQINKPTRGRDHWSNAMSVLFAGGGTPGGQVVGATDSQGLRRRRARAVAGELRLDGLRASSASTRTRSSTRRKAGPAHLVSDPTPIKELM